MCIGYYHNYSYDFENLGAQQSTFLIDLQLVVLIFQQIPYNRMIHWILVSLNGPTKIPYNRFLYVEVYCALIEYENGKIKPAHYLTQIIYLDDPND